MNERTAEAPNIIIPPPGPRAKALIEQDEMFTSPSYTRVYPLAVKQGRGAEIEDLDGNLFLDFNAGIAVCATGHCHPRVVASIQQQAAELLHMSGTDFYYPPQANLAKKLAEIAPGAAQKRIFFTNSGAESVEAAFKLARHHTGRKHVIAFFGAFHGRTMGALSLTASKTVQRRGFSPLIPQVSHVEYPNTYRNDNLSGEECIEKTFAQIEQLFARVVSPDEVAAFVVEPIQGEGGYLTPPFDFLVRLQQLAEKHGILLVADEVQSGMGRTGRMFACDHYGVEPDIICLAKGLASGMPLGAIIAKESVMNWPLGSHASTFGGNPVACVAALETIALLEEELIANAETQGEWLLDQFEAMKPRHKWIGDVRGKGLMIGVELVKSRTSKEPAVAARDEIVQRAFTKGLLLLGCGKNTIRFCPPLVVSRKQCETAVRIFEECLHEIATDE